MYDVVALGEILIDFTPSGYNDLGIELFGCNPGGAPVNLLAMYAKLGGSTAFIGKVGEDSFGRFLTKTLADAGIALTGVLRTQEAPTTLAFVHLDASGDRSFSFYRKPGADILLREEDLPDALLTDCHIFHFGTVSMSDEPSRSATIAAVNRARAAGALISYDPNYRPALWRSEAEASEIMRSMCTLADLIKVSEEEMTLITGEQAASVGAQKLLDFGAKLVLVTGGEKGCYYATHACQGFVPAYQVDVVDTTGSGDAFMGALLSRLKGLSGGEIAALPADVLAAHVRFASAAGGLTATARGAIPTMPTEEQILRCMQEKPAQNAKLLY